MSAPRFVRGTKSRLFLYLGAVTFIGVVVYVFHGTQVQLIDVRKASEKCQQQQEAMSAQLQVIFEYKIRLEKSLQQEKADHRQMREELQGKADEEKHLRDKENLEAINKYSSLQQQYKLLQSQHEDLNDECNKVRSTRLHGLEEKSKLESQVQAVQQELNQVQAAKEKDIEDLKTQLMKIEGDNERLSRKVRELSSQTQAMTDQNNNLKKRNIQLERELADTKEKLRMCERQGVRAELPAPAAVLSPESVAPKRPAENKDDQPLRMLPSSSTPRVKPPQEQDQNVLPEPELHQAGNLEKTVAKSTTPQINPDAVLSRDKAALNGGGNIVPVPAPQHEQPVAARPDSHKQDSAKEQAQDMNVMAVAPAPDWHVQQDFPNMPPPAGVVPAPHGYNYHQNGLNENGGQVDTGDRNMWHFLAHPPQQVRNYNNDVGFPENQQDNEVGDNPMNQPAREEPRNAHRNLQRRKFNPQGLHEGNRLQLRGEEEKEIPRQMHNQYQYNGDYDKEGQRGDMQIEEGDEDDDDVDQIDYGNEGGNAAAAKLKRVVAKPAAHINGLDSVMVQPK